MIFIFNWQMYATANQKNAAAYIGPERPFSISPVIAIDTTTAMNMIAKNIDPNIADRYDRSFLRSLACCLFVTSLFT